jgi:valyl-tRNA synthetase
MELAKTYSHREVEAKWYKYWIDSGAFAPARGVMPYYSMVIPPPNVTGSLHMGHALNNTLQDVLCRYKRMAGFSVLWVPGTDHAGIATQNVVERQLATRGQTRAQLGREKFIERVWQWKQEAGNTILHQLKALGVSCDWQHERFTMDEGLSRAVREAFVRLWQDKLLYRAERLINWCPRCKTALADIEVIHEERDGNLWYVRYPLADDPSRALIVATTRPETMLGDTAVAVHPEDQRYRDLHGKMIRLPITGRIVPLIADNYVEQAFGTGALKITPGHDFNDYEIGQRYGLDRINIFDADARIDASDFAVRGEQGEWVARYAGKDRLEARRLIVAELQEKGFLDKVEAHRHAIGHCYRCQTVIEPYLTPQWFVDIKPLAEPAMEAVRSGAIRIVPEGWSNSYFAWMENIKDWCISRQIWWGHQIPAWYCKRCEGANVVQTGDGEYRLTKDATPIVGREPPSECPNCGATELIQDPDVLDTWFSSGLWPFSTLGWPDDTDDLKSFYPTSALVTGFDILFFWVARMIMMGLKFMGDVPFRDVYIHALVRDEQGQKMSKSKGNVIDPLEVMQEYGTDAFRFTLAAMAAMGRDIKLAPERIAGYQNFVNKLWNATRFVLLHAPRGAAEFAGKPSMLSAANLSFPERWIRSRLSAAIDEARSALEAYRFNDFAGVLYQFTWHEFCDWYIEMSKPALTDGSAEDRARSRQLLVEVLRQILLLLHPIMPFVTEEIWQAVDGTGQTIMLQTYPRPEAGWRDADAERDMEFLMGVIRAVRNLRSEFNCPPGKEVRVIFHAAGRELSLVQNHAVYLRLLAKVGTAEYADGATRPKGAATAIVGSTEIYLPLDDQLNLDEELQRLDKEARKISDELERVRRKLANGDFLTKAKEEVVQKEREKSLQYEDKLRALQQSIARIKELADIRAERR